MFEEEITFIWKSDHKPQAANIKEARLTMAVICT